MRKLLAILLSGCAIAGAQTKIDDTQVKAPPSAVTVIKVITPAGFVNVQPDGVTFVIDLASRLAKCIVPGGQVTFVDSEIPGGTIGGTNAVFTLAFAPAPAASLVLWRNGLKQRAGVDFDLSGTTITFRTGLFPVTGDLLEASYRR